MLAAALVIASLVIRIEEDHQGYRGLHEQFYQSWTLPNYRSVSCCNKMDCAPAWAKWENGHLFMKRSFDTKWTEVKASILESNQSDPRESPDGQSHVCINSSGQAICAVLGSGL